MGFARSLSLMGLGVGVSKPVLGAGRAVLPEVRHHHVPLGDDEDGVDLVSGLGFRVLGFGFRVSGFGLRVSGFGFRVLCFGFRVQGAGCTVSGLGVPSRACCARGRPSRPSTSTRTRARGTARCGEGVRVGLRAPGAIHCSRLVGGSSVAYGEDEAHGRAPALRPEARGVALPSVGRA